MARRFEFDTHVHALGIVVCEISENILLYEYAQIVLRHFLLYGAVESLQMPILVWTPRMIVPMLCVAMVGEELLEFWPVVRLEAPDLEVKIFSHFSHESETCMGIAFFEGIAYPYLEYTSRAVYIYDRLPYRSMK